MTMKELTSKDIVDFFETNGHRAKATYGSYCRIGS